MADAVDHDLRDANPCKRTRLPRRDRGAGDGDMTALTRAEWDKVRAGFDEARVSSRGNILEPDALGSAYRDFFEVMVRTGLRWSEITALEPRHVDAEARTLRVEQAWKRQPDSSFVLGAPKTPKSRRTIDLDAKSWGIVAARLTVKSPWLFPSPARTRARMSHTAAWMALSSASANAEIGKTPRIHDLRHTHASWLLAAGVDMYRVSRRLGHESIVTTTSTYGHLLPDTDATIVAALDQL
jgi:integrase